MIDETVRVDSSRLNDLHRYLTTAGAARVDDVASGIGSLGGMDINAFGSFFAQPLGVPCRAAMSAVANHATDVARQLADMAKDVGDVVANYYEIDQENTNRVCNLMEL